METKEYETKILTPEDRFENIPSYKHLRTDFEDDVDLTEVEGRVCCARLGIFRQYHYDTCPKFEDNSN